MIEGFELGAVLIMRSIRAAQDAQVLTLLELASEGCCVCGLPATALQTRWVPTQGAQQYRWLCERPHPARTDAPTWMVAPIKKVRVLRVDDGTRE